MSAEADLKGWTLGGEGGNSGYYAVVDRLYVARRVAYWNAADSRWSWDGRIHPAHEVWYHRPFPTLPADVGDRWKP